MANRNSLGKLFSDSIIYGLSSIVGRFLNYLLVPLYTYTLDATFAAAKRIYDGGAYVTPFVPPATQEGHALIRTSYMVTLTEALIDEAVGIIAKVFTEMGLLGSRGG